MVANEIHNIEVRLSFRNPEASAELLKKDNRGFDLKQLLIGSEGTLGIVTAATLRLVPALADRVVIMHKGRISQILSTNLPRPHLDMETMRSLPQFAETRHRLWQALHGRAALAA